MANVTMTTTIDLAGLRRRLTDAERKVFTRHRKRFLDAFKITWRGWAYDGRAKGAPRNVSLRGWKSRIETSADRAVLVISNETEANGEHYVSYVHRAGDPMIEYQRIWATAQEQLMPALVADLTAAIAATVGARVAPKRVNGRGGTSIIRGDVTL